MPAGIFASPLLEGAEMGRSTEVREAERCNHEGLCGLEVQDISKSSPLLREVGCL